MKLKQSLYALSLAAGSVFSASALAQQYPVDPVPEDITFEGMILASVCTARVDGGNTVTLEPVFVQELAEKDKTAKPKEFTISVDCPMNLGDADRFWAHFEAANPAPDGRFEPNVGSTNVSFQLLDSNGETVIKAGGAASAGGPGADQGTGSDVFSGNPPAVSASKKYVVRYYAEEGLTNADAGPVSADGTYTVYFY